MFSPLLLGDLSPFIKAQATKAPQGHVSLMPGQRCLKLCPFYSLGAFHVQTPSQGALSVSEELVIITARPKCVFRRGRNLRWLTADSVFIL